MATITHQLRRILTVLGLLLFAFTQAVLAFPPAPTFTIHGIARDTFGWTLKATEQVVLDGCGPLSLRWRGTTRYRFPQTISGATRPQPFHHRGW